jgi:hypothetical protein
MILRGTYLNIIEYGSEIIKVTIFDRNVAVGVSPKTLSDFVDGGLASTGVTSPPAFHSVSSRLTQLQTAVSTFAACRLGKGIRWMIP